jgi:hypothetical protein
MKIVINGDFGCYGSDVTGQYKNFVIEHRDDRTNAELVEFVETHPHECGDLCVVEIPDTATDWDINEYDGFERIIYVLDGKLHYAGTC